SPVDSREHLRVDGVARSYLLHRPAARATKTRKPLVIAFHGRGETATSMRDRTRLNGATAARGMLIAYPEGLHKGWGAGTARTEQRPDPDADIGFTEALAGRMVRTEGADPRRIYVVGFSNGGSMALRIAAERPRLVAAAGAVAAQLPTGNAEVKPTGAVPMILIHGADDTVRPLAGRPAGDPPKPGDEPITPTMSTRATAETFAKAAAAGAPAEPEKTPARGYDRTDWTSPKAPVRLLVMHKAGHTWPGSTEKPPPGFGRTSTAIDATDTILDFLDPHVQKQPGAHP
ncbi:PHB depolymerase family esterase, partial [Streptomyces sp. T-3]|nr:PHB depolymerase family esterase [Streptomyces sp. T-3]